MSTIAALTAPCAPPSCHGPTHMFAFDINPMHWLGDAAGEVIADAWMAAMTSLWSGALWLLKLAFTVIDAFTTPDLTAHGPIGAVLPTTLWLGATLAVVMMFVQLSVALVRRDGQSLGRVLLGIGQFGLVWVSFLGVAMGLVTAATGLSRGILRAMLGVDTMGGVDLSQSWPDAVSDVTLATVLGVLSIFLVIPASFAYVIIMFVREAALIILVATAPISAGGLLSDTGKAWFWKALRWFFSCLLISPMAALLLGIGVTVSDGIISPPPELPADPSMDQVLEHASTSSAAHAGMAVVGCIVIAIGACCPLVLFRLLSFVEPGTASGAALRQSWSDAGGMSGVLSGGGSQAATSSAASRSGGDGRSGGEAGAESQTQSRLAGALGAVGKGMQVATSAANRAVDIGSDVLGQSGVGAPGYSLTPTDQRSSRSSATGRSLNDPAHGDGVDNGTDPGPTTSTSTTPPPATTPPSTPPTSPMSSMPSGPTAPGGGAGGAAGGGGAEAAVAV